MIKLNNYMQSEGIILRNARQRDAVKTHPGEA